jgi:tRNA 2-thiouridine synthesizing protein A
MRTTTHAFLDTLGQLCPQPIIETAQKIKGLRKGQILEIISDDWGMITDLPAWCKSTGHVLISMKEEKEMIRCYVKKNG